MRCYYSALSRADTVLSVNSACMDVKYIVTVSDLFHYVRNVVPANNRICQCSDSTMVNKYFTTGNEIFCVYVESGPTTYS